MNLYTFQIGKWRKVDSLNIDRLDVTIKSGESLLAPTWTLLMGYKKGVISKEEYTMVYVGLLEERFRSHPEYFKSLMERQTTALGCYCPADVFCHRHLLVNFLESKTEVIYSGEIK